MKQYRRMFLMRMAAKINSQWMPITARYLLLWNSPLQLSDYSNHQNVSQDQRHCIRDESPVPRNNRLQQVIGQEEHRQRHGQCDCFSEKGQLVGMAIRAYRAVEPGSQVHILEADVFSATGAAQWHILKAPLNKLEWATKPLSFRSAM